MSYKVLMEFLSLEPRLLAVFSQLVNLWKDGSITITSIHRSKEQNRQAGAKSLIHVVGPPYRAMDISIRGLTGGQEEAQRICDLLNDIWVYDATRPNKVVAYCKPHGTGPHIHLQVHPRTRQRHSEAA
jgi:hypothetical protein